LNETVAAIIGGHHGKPQSGDQREQLDVFTANYYQADTDKETQQPWKDVQNELIAYGLELAGYSDISEVPAVNQPEAVILEGLLIMADWLASSTCLNNDPNKPMFNLIGLDQGFNDVDMTARYQGAISTWAVNDAWIPEEVNDANGYYQQHFGFKPRQIQSVMEEQIKETIDPGLVIIEAEMGIGKTEIALTAAEQLAYATGRTGIYIGLPTQATTNAMFDRVEKWLTEIAEIDGSKLDIKLLHGKSSWNSRYTSLPRAEDIESEETDEGAVTVNSWFSGKKSILADFAVGTIDNLLLMGLKQKHLFLRHLGFSNKVVIIDEVHAYDMYMSSYLLKALEWLGAYHVPVIILSATLPKEKRNELIKHYGKGKYVRFKKVLQAEEGWENNQAYPLLSILDGKNLRQYADFGLKTEAKELQVSYINDDPVSVLAKVKEQIKDGGIAGIIVNTVKRAQEFAKLVDPSQQCLVLHSAFLASDRTELEDKLQKMIGKNGERPEKMIVIGTQVLEQSLDIDFDVLFTDIAPIDLLLQRAGRLHRHKISRPAGLQQRQLYVMKPDADDYGPANEAVYEKYYLQKTEHFLPEKVLLPNDISSLVQLVYDEATDDQVADLDEAKDKWRKDSQLEMSKAGSFQINAPIYPRKDDNLRDEMWVEQLTIHRWLDRDKGSLDDNQASAAVRDIRESIEVILLKEISGEYYLMNGKKVSEVDDEAIAQEVIRLPNSVTPDIEQAINKLEEETARRFPDWQNSSWLKGSLALVLGENAKGNFNGYDLCYSAKTGLSYEKEVDN
ncbi:CRISPR-associated helicase Cas3', partial [Lactobacillus nasalidis]